MDTEILAGINLNEKSKWGENIKVYTRRIRNRKVETFLTSDPGLAAKLKSNGTGNKSVQEDNVADQNIKNLSDKSSDSLAITDGDSIHEDAASIIADGSLQIEEKDNDIVSDQTLRIVPTEDLNIEGGNGTIQDESMQIILMEGLNLKQVDENNTPRDSGNSESDITTVEKKDDKGNESDHESKDKNIDTLPDQSVHSLATPDCNLVLEENERVAGENLQIKTTKELNLVDEQESETINEQSLQITATKEDKSDSLRNKSLYEEDCNDTTHDQSSEVENDTVLDNQLQNRVTIDLDYVQESEQVSPLNSGGNDVLSAHNNPPWVAVENASRKCDVDAVVKPLITNVNGQVRFSLAPGRPKNEIRGLKRKLHDELDQVKSLVQRLEAKKIQLSSYSAGNGVYSSSHEHLHDQVEEVGDLSRVNSVVGSAGYYDSRPFQNPSGQVFENDNDMNDCIEKRTPKENKYYQSSDFLLAKDRLPPADSNKKLKTHGMRRECGEIGYGFARSKYNAQALKSCNNLLARLMRHKFGWVFNKPVDANALGLHDYHYIIRNPMDLGTIKSRLGKNLYESPREFAEDVRLTFRNAMTYNPKGQDVHVMAEQLSDMFEDKWAAIESEYNYNLRYGVHDMCLPSTPLPRNVHQPPPTSLYKPPALDMRVLERAESMTMPTDYYRLKPNTPVGRTPVPKKPKAKDLNKRDMTYDEKQRLSTHLQNLPSDKLDAVVQIIKKGSSSLSQRDDEIEVDIDSVDTETLWELDRFVTNYKKNLSKKKRRAELAQARAEARPAVPLPNHAPSVIQAAPETSKQDQNNVATPPLPGERPGVSSSSSSSSSDSDSDSSDSDSDSSSASDAGHSPKT